MIYLDTGCLLKLYYPEPESAKVAALVGTNAIAFLPLHDLELSNALELKVFRKEAKPAQARATHALVEADVRAGALYRPAVVWEDALADAKALARTHTRALGCRSLDILHCAAARQLSATSFVTSDARQRRLALAIGLACPAILAMASGGSVMGTGARAHRAAASLRFTRSMRSPCVSWRSNRWSPSVP